MGIVAKTFQKEKYLSLNYSWERAAFCGSYWSAFNGRTFQPAQNWREKLRQEINSSFSQRQAVPFNHYWPSLWRKCTKYCLEIVKMIKYFYREESKKKIKWFLRSYSAVMVYTGEIRIDCMSCEKDVFCGHQHQFVLQCNDSVSFTAHLFCFLATTQRLSFISLPDMIHLWYLLISSLVETRDFYFPDRKLSFRNVMWCLKRVNGFMLVYSGGGGLNWQYCEIRLYACDGDEKTDDLLSVLRQYVQTINKPRIHEYIIYM